MPRQRQIPSNAARIMILIANLNQTVCCVGWYKTWPTPRIWGRDASLQQQASVKQRPYHRKAIRAFWAPSLGCKACCALQESRARIPRTHKYVRHGAALYDNASVFLTRPLRATGNLAYLLRERGTLRVGSMSDIHQFRILLDDPMWEEEE